MTTKLTITISPDPEYLAHNEIDAAMERTIADLAELGLVPLRKITLTIECKDESVEAIEDAIDAALSGRPMGIDVVLKTSRERHVARESRMVAATPMDRAGWAS